MKKSKPQKRFKKIEMRPIVESRFLRMEKKSEVNLETMEKLLREKGIGKRISEIMEDKEFKEVIETISREITNNNINELEKNTGLDKEGARKIYITLGKIIVFETIKNEITKLNREYGELVSQKEMNDLVKIFTNSEISHLDPDFIGLFSVFKLKNTVLSQDNINDMILVLRSSPENTSRKFQTPELINKIKMCIANNIPIEKITKIIFSSLKRKGEKKEIERTIKYIFESMGRKYPQLNSKERATVENIIVSGTANEIKDFSDIGAIFEKIKEKETQALRIIEQNKKPAKKQGNGQKKNEQPKSGRMIIQKPEENKKETKRIPKPEVLTYNQKIRTYIGQVTNPDLRNKIIFILNRLNIAIDKKILRIPKEHIFNRFVKLYPNPNSIQKEGYADIARKMKIGLKIFESEKKEEPMENILERIANKKEYKPDDSEKIKKWIKEKKPTAQRYDRLTEMEKQALEIIVLREMAIGGVTKRIPRDLIRKYLPNNYGMFVEEIINTLLEKNLIQFPKDKEHEKTGRNRTYYIINPNLLPFFQS